MKKNKNKHNLKYLYIKQLFFVFVFLFIFGFFGIVEAQTYENTGTFVGKILFSDIEPAIIVDTIDYFGYNASTTASTTIEVQFSRDKINWYNASGTLDSWDTLSNGNNLEIGSGAIDLSALNTTWSGWDNYYYPYYYYKIKLTSEDNEVSPVLYEVRTYYTAGGDVPTLPFYHASGTFTSTNLLEGIEPIVAAKFGYNASTTASTTIKVQFSNDKEDWYNSSGELSGWDVLGDGDFLLEENAIDISGLNWQGDTFYYRMEFETTDIYETSALHEIILYYSDIPEGRIKGGIKFKGGIRIK